LGKNLEVGKVVEELVRRFEISVVDHAGVWDGRRMGASWVEGLWLRMEERREV
jgi:hypothetical protein